MSAIRPLHTLIDRIEYAKRLVECDPPESNDLASAELGHLLSLLRDHCITFIGELRSIYRPDHDDDATVFSDVKFVPGGEYQPSMDLAEVADRLRCLAERGYWSIVWIPLSKGGPSD